MLSGPTSVFIVAWAGLLSVAWALLSYAWFSWRPAPTLSVRSRLVGGAVGNLSLLPALVLAVSLLVACREFWRVNLIFPLQLDLSLGTLVMICLTPAVVLSLASGMLVHTQREVKRQLASWQQKPFVVVVRGRGCSPSRAIRKIVISNALTNSWRETLPWLFSELVVVEAIFNAPGLGASAWHHARQHAYGALVYDLVCLGSLYALVYTCTLILQRRLGRKLASYH